MIDQKIEAIKSRLQLPLPGAAAHELMMGRVRNFPAKVPDDARQSAVMCLLFPIDGQLNILLMKRREDNTAHSGQVSFPGGRYEPEDLTLENTALREAFEEVGVLQEELTILGPLTTLYIPVSNFNVSPFLAYAEKRPEYTLSPDEVSYVMEVPLSDLFNHKRKIKTNVISPAMPDSIFNVNAYQLEDSTIIWGATAMILSEIEMIIGNPEVL